MNIMFCGRTFTYYADMYRTMLTRVFSLVNRTVNAIMGLGEEELTLEEKEKVTIMVDGLFGILNFIIKAVYEKVVEVVELKLIYDSMELHDFKQIVNVY